MSAAAEEEILQGFLNRGLLNIGDNDVRLGHFRKAAQALATRWKEDRTRIIPGVLASLDPHVPAGNPIIREAEEALQLEWNTYRNAYPDPPRQFLRAIVLEALRLLGTEEPACAAAIWLTAVSIFPFHDLGREQEVIRPMLELFGRAHESAAQDLWDTQDIAPTETVKPPKLTYTKVNPTTLEERLGAAVGPHNAQSKAYAQPVNPQWPNSGPPWSYAFPAIAATAISEAVDAAIAATIGNLAKPLAELATLAASSKDALASNLLGPTGISGRTTLLWWRQALFSPHLQRGYRELAAPTAAIIMSVDLSDQTSPQTPLSVEYFLREAVNEISREYAASRRKPTLGDFVSDALSSEGTTHLRSAFATSHDTPSVAGDYIPLLEIMRSMATESGYTPELFRTRLGLGPELPLTISDAAVWLFRDLQAARLLATRAAES